MPSHELVSRRKKVVWKQVFPDLCESADRDVQMRQDVAAEVQGAAEDGRASGIE